MGNTRFKAYYEMKEVIKVKERWRQVYWLCVTVIEVNLRFIKYFIFCWFIKIWVPVFRHPKSVNNLKNTLYYPWKNLPFLKNIKHWNSQNSAISLSLKSTLDNRDNFIIAFTSIQKFFSQKYDICFHVYFCSAVFWNFSILKTEFKCI